MSDDPRRLVNAMTTYIHKPTGDIVQYEKWRWEAYYLDGTVLKQFDKLSEEAGEFHKFAEIDQSQLRTFRMVNDDGRAVTILFDPFKARRGRVKLVHKYINRGMVKQRLNADGEMVDVGQPIQVRNYLAGYVENGHNHFILITYTGEIIMTDDPAKVQINIHTKEVDAS